MVFIKYILSSSTALFIIKVVTALQHWESDFGVRWNENCDFEGNHVVNVTIPGSQCGSYCQHTVADCTHFTFTTTFDGIGTCWIKSGRISPEKAIHSNSQGSVCGFLVISWLEETDLYWSYNCNFPGKYIKKESSEGKLCGMLCKRNPPCNHFVWTDVEGQGRICWMKFDNKISKESAVLTPGSRGAVCGILKNGGETIHTTPPVSSSENDECECVC